MKGPSESEFQAQVIDYARLTGWRVAHFRSVKVQRPDGTCYYQTPVQADGKGFPDLVLVRRSVLLFVELKVGKNACSAQQKLWLAELRESGALVYVWYPEDWPQIEEVLR